MDKQEIISRCDHTLLKPFSTWEDMIPICEDALKYHTASVCIPPCYVKPAHKNYPDLNVCTVIGFPNGYNTTEVKVAEAIQAIADGASEIDMVINIGEMKAGNYDYVLDEIKALRKATEGKILKVIVETCYLDEAEKIKVCELVTEAGADFIKTSTGFGPEGAKIEDIELFKKHIGPNVKMKAAGGISTVEDLEAFVKAGCARIGTSRAIGLLKDK
ncbi:MAG: deoxyribose-phosphate aldolase [Coriobacteriales bacterium]|jgi:deoxyribose-phosphate aldolase|uniref:deoxyribose-phosphate aldolase n=1 Tax=Pseudoramibacter sp. TaxID=2034862 RepID=UPI0025E899DB|nr:deoxyribose-phosphate aldolase [Pseudoramibacter sp.]MCH4072265.1 deoxyribose-phosphate aldolase [Pseudoramibacter sp.]MCH4106035.1 deoxyribose-phosphate aldolase [Pseudoramibacter sp.]